MERDLESPMMFLKQKDKNKDIEFDKEDAPKDSYFPEMPIDSRMTNSSPTLSNQKLLHTESVDQNMPTIESIQNNSGSKLIN